jgi:hypothetical protein
MEEEKVHPIEKILDSPILLLLLGLAVMFLFYTFWGVLELVSLPPSSLP